MQEAFRPCPLCGGWTLDSWSGVGGPCASCYFTTRRLTERFERQMQSRLVRWVARWDWWFRRWFAWLEATIARLKEKA
jgi:hypothetical protein